MVRPAPDAATVYFARSAGADLSIEALRRETRIEQVELLSRALEYASAGPYSPWGRAEVGVVALAVVALLETAAASWLTQDAVFSGLGRRRFLTEAEALANRIVALGAVQ